MVATTINDNSAVHSCPICGVRCAVSIEEMKSAEQAGKDIRISCHGCGDVFDPVSSTSDVALDIAICPHCTGQFSVPPLPANQDVALSCPLCEADVASNEMEYQQRDGQVVKKKSAVTRRLAGLFSRKKQAAEKQQKAPVINESDTQTPAAFNIPEFDKDHPDTGQSTTEPANPKRGTDKSPAGDSVVMRLFKPNNKKDNADTFPTRDEGSRAKRHAHKKPGSSRLTRPIALVSLLALLLLAGVTILLTLSPTKPTQILEVFMAQQVKPANFAITNAVYERVETSVGKSVVITVTMTNTGETAGTPRTVMVELLNEDRQPILSWPVTTNALSVEAGGSRALVTRIFEPPAAFNDIQVTLRSN